MSLLAVDQHEARRRQRVLPLRPARTARIAGSVACGVLLALAAAELALRIWTPVSVARAVPTGPVADVGAVDGMLRFDRELGFAPVLGGKLYGEHGALWNEYALAKPAGLRRVLFLGDSVTRRGAIVDALRSLHGDAGFEWWNAGVEAWTTGQEVAWFRDVLEPIRPDDVVLTFHLNDFDTTPIVFVQDGRYVAIRARVASREVVPWLLRHAYLYRWWVSLRLRGWEMGRHHPSVAAELESHLRELRDLCAERGAELAVLVLPLLVPPEAWPPEALHRRRVVLDALERLGIRHYDLLPALEATLAAGLDPRERPGDVHHPSNAFGAAAARLLHGRGLFRDAVGLARSGRGDQ